MFFRDGIENTDTVVKYFCSEFFKAYLIGTIKNKSGEIYFSKIIAQKQACEGKD